MQEDDVHKILINIKSYSHKVFAITVGLPSIMKLRIIAAALLAKLASSYNLFDKEPRIVGGTEVRWEHDILS